MKWHFWGPLPNTHCLSPLTLTAHGHRTSVGLPGSGKTTEKKSPNNWASVVSVSGIGARCGGGGGEESRSAAPVSQSVCLCHLWLEYVSPLGPPVALSRACSISVVQCSASPTLCEIHSATHRSIICKEYTTLRLFHGSYQQTGPQSTNTTLNWEIQFLVYYSFY